jgi:hypothetical protein
MRLVLRGFNETATGLSHDQAVWWIETRAA